jgi:hypothetical protein
MTPLKITEHAKIQLGKRYGLAWAPHEFRQRLTAKSIFRMSGGEVVPFQVSRSGYGYAVLHEGRVVTVLTERHAFVDCPRAVFTFLVRRGLLTRALSLRSYYKSMSLVQQDAQSVRYPRSCDVVWCAFTFCEDRQKFR